MLTLNSQKEINLKQENLFYITRYVEDKRNKRVITILTESTFSCQICQNLRHFHWINELYKDTEFANYACALVVFLQ